MSKTSNTTKREELAELIRINRRQTNIAFRDKTITPGMILMRRDRHGDREFRYYHVRSVNKNYIVASYRKDSETKFRISWNTQRETNSGDYSEFMLGDDIIVALESELLASDRRKRRLTKVLQTAISNEWKMAEMEESRIREIIAEIDPSLDIEAAMNN